MSDSASHSLAALEYVCLRLVSRRRVSSTVSCSKHLQCIFVDREFKKHGEVKASFRRSKCLCRRKFLNKS